MDDHQFLNHRSMHGADIQWPRGLIPLPQGSPPKNSHRLRCVFLFCFAALRYSEQWVHWGGQRIWHHRPSKLSNNMTPSPQRIWHQRPLQNFYKNMAPSPLTPSQSRWTCKYSKVGSQFARLLITISREGKPGDDDCIIPGSQVWARPALG